MTMVCAEEILFTKTHEWVKCISDTEVVVGITPHAANQLGDIVFVDLPSVGEQCAVAEEVLVIESVKTAADVYAPVAGEIIAVNEALADHPDLVNKEADSAGWLYRVSVSDDWDRRSLLTAEDYEQLLVEEGV